MNKTKIILLTVIIVAIFIFTAIIVSAAGGVSIYVNNKAISASVTGINDNGVIMVPAKEFAASLGGSFKYDESTLTGTIKQGENEIAFRLDDSVVKFNGKYIQAPAPMKVVGYRFMIPAVFTSEKLGALSGMSALGDKLIVLQPVNGKITYQVMPNDSLWIISRLFKVSIDSIKSLNNLTGDAVYVGQKLAIKNFTPTVSTIAAYTSKSANLFSGPGFNYSTVKILAAWTPITVYSKSGDFYKVTTSAGSGYIYNTSVYIKQDISDNATNSKYFDNNIPVDTSKDYITYTNYTVKSGDDLWKISQNMGVPDYELRSVNNLPSTVALQIGQVIKIPVHNVPVKSTMGPQYGEVLDWFTEGQYVFSIGKVGKLIDVATGKSFMAKRTMGANHSDTETLTAQDSQTMKEVFGGSWTWLRRSFILEVDGRRLAVSVAGMAHAGVDGAPFLANVNNRSDDWGTGPNYDSIAGNGMDGHFDVYFLNSVRHVDNMIDSTHQYNVMVSGGLQ